MCIIFCLVCLTQHCPFKIQTRVCAIDSSFYITELITSYGHITTCLSIYLYKILSYFQLLSITNKNYHEYCYKSEHVPLFLLA